MSGIKNNKHQTEGAFEILKLDTHQSDSLDG